MKADIFDLTGKKTKSIELPDQFNEEIHPDLIRRAVLAILGNDRQPYGANLDAGKKGVAYLSKRRHSYKTSYGIGISRTPRKIVWKRGGRFGWIGALAPNTAGGRRAHPPKVNKVLTLKINNKERRKAIRSAISGAESKILDNNIEDIKTTKESQSILQNFGLKDIKIKIRAGRGKTRGRKYRVPRNLLIVVSGKCNALNSCRNIPGIDIVDVKSLNAKLLAPNGIPGRRTIWSEKAIDVMKKENLFK